MSHIFLFLKERQLPNWQKSRIDSGKFQGQERYKIQVCTGCCTLDNVSASLPQRIGLSPRRRITAQRPA